RSGPRRYRLTRTSSRRGAGSRCWPGTRRSRSSWGWSASAPATPDGDQTSPGTRCCPGTGALGCASGARYRRAIVTQHKSGLAVRAPDRDPAPGVTALVGGAEKRAAAAAGPAGPAVNPGFLAPPPGARGDLAEPLLVRFEQPFGEVHQRGQVGDRTDRAPRVHAAQEQRLRLVRVADAGQVALVEQGLADRPGRVRTQPALRLRRIPVRAEQVRAEVPDRRWLGGGGQGLHDAEQVAARLPGV